MPDHPVHCGGADGDRDLMAADSIFRGKMISTGAAVFFVAIAVRLTSLSESFWVDELHSAWCVWSSFSDVFPRSEAGHQSPAYFAALWIWKRCVGESEFSLRISSVIAVAIASLVLTVGVVKWTRCLAAGAAAGLTLALESNSLFFGTELRPYAFVILFAAIATVCFLKLAAVDSRHRVPFAWVGFVMSILMATLVQPTSLGVLAWLPVALGVTWIANDVRAQWKCDRWDIFLVVAITISVIFLWRTTLGQSWSQRQDWASFATATDLLQLWTAWNWTWMLIVPVVLVAIGTAPRQIALALALVALLATTGYWIVSWSGWLPLWHRRYFVAVLPLLAALVGGSVASIADRDQRLGWVATLAIVLGLAVSQGTLPRLLRCSSGPVVIRGEDWRSAVRWVNENAVEGDRIFLDGGLIEGRSVSPKQATADLADYLKYPVRGPYRVEFPIVLALPNLQAVEREGAGATFVITRHPARRIARDQFFNAKILDFDGVTVIALP